MLSLWIWGSNITVTWAYPVDQIWPGKTFCKSKFHLKVNHLGLGYVGESVSGGWLSEFLMDQRLYAGYSDRSITYSPLIVSWPKNK